MVHVAFGSSDTQNLPTTFQPDTVSQCIIESIITMLLIEMAISITQKRICCLHIRTVYDSIKYYKYINSQKIEKHTDIKM